MDNSIQMKIARTAAKNWGQEEPKNLEESLGITWDSEVEAVKGIVQTLSLDETIQERLVGTKNEEGKLNRDGEIYINDKISEDISITLQESLKGDNKSTKILSILSAIHNGWVKNNKNNFLKPDRNKERQFVPLELLDWGEAKSDLLFLKPIFEAAGVEIDEQQLQQAFEIKQQEYMIDNGIYSHEDLVAHLQKGSKTYSALQGLETKNGGNIEELLKNPEITEKMASQIESRVSIKSREEMALDVLESENPKMDEILWISTITCNGFREDKCPRFNGPISKKELLLSKVIGKPYPTYIESGVINYNHEEYSNAITVPREGQCDIADQYAKSIQERKDKGHIESDKMDKQGIVRYGYDSSGDQMKGSLEYISKEDLLYHGIDPVSVGWSDRITSKDFAVADKEQGLVKTEVSKFKQLIERINGLFKEGKDEEHGRGE